MYCKGCLNVKWDFRMCDLCHLKLCKECLENRNHTDSFKCINCHKVKCITRRANKQCLECHYSN